ncbi:alpha/beta hydrolase family protein [Stigmatella erecta]|uniref:Acetyl esterase/lipase n=1 Tax=Stigmatella erecta TaxID=83460 RepID=A0A1I0L7P9_9BACT|nr:alpha/beta hydrolase [Stigmatella erecta]SEU35262.1 Acetyl esterase/lipase [Stigmatella erecta]
MDPLWMLEAPPPAADARLAYGSGEHHFGELRLPAGPGPHPTVLVVHGGFWRARYGLEHVGHLCADLARRGFATWSLEYRRVGHPGGGWPGTLEDVVQGAAHLRTLARTWPLDLNQVVGLGHSAGGHLILCLAARHRDTGLPPLRGVVPLAAVSDVVRVQELGLGSGIVETFFGGTPAQVPGHYQRGSPLALAPLGVRQILLHGALDDIVPLALSERYQAHAAALGDDVRLITLPQAAHFEVINPRAPEWEQVVEALRALL